MAKIQTAFQNAFRKSWRLGFLVAFVTWAFSWVVQKWLSDTTITITASVVDVRQQILARGVAPALGEGVLSFLQGFIPIGSVPALIILVFGSILLVFLGKFFVSLGFFKLRFLGKSPMMEMATVLFWGFLATALLMGWITGISVWTTLFALFIYYIGVSIVIGLLMRMKGVSRFLAK